VSLLSQTSQSFPSTARRRTKVCVFRDTVDTATYPPAFASYHLSILLSPRLSTKSIIPPPVCTLTYREHPSLLRKRGRKRKFK
jgi:hypothetical protein